MSERWQDIMRELTEKYPSLSESLYIFLKIGCSSPEELAKFKAEHHTDSELIDFLKGETEIDPLVEEFRAALSEYRARKKEQKALEAEKNKHIEDRKKMRAKYEDNF